MIEHKLITFHKQDVIEALEDFYLKTLKKIIDINFDAKALEYSNIREVTVKVVSMNTEGIKAELEQENIKIGESLSSFSGYITTTNDTYTNYPTSKTI